MSPIQSKAYIRLSISDYY